MRSLVPPPAPGAEPLDVYVDAPRPAPPGRPWVLANMVAGLDGATAVGGRVGILSNETDKRLFRLLRSLADVILVGASTVRAEGYGPARPNAERRAQREARGQAPAPAIAVVTATMQLDWASRFFTEAEARPIVVTGAAAPAEARERAAEVADVVVAGDERVDMATALADLAGRGASVVLCEGGGLLNAELVAAGLLDELCLTIAPVLGGDALRIVAPGVIPGPVEGELASVVEDEGHLFLRYLLRPVVAAAG